jgi:glutamate racemase
MIGVLASGVGGENTVRELRFAAPLADIMLFKDVKNAPYGKKSESELVRIVSDGIYRLLSSGADHVLIGCCTASCVWKHLSEELKNKSCPITDATAQRARNLTRTGAIAVIATEATVNSKTFSRILSGLCKTELATQELVSMVEMGVCDENVTDEALAKIENMLIPLSYAECDTLILGCTHFPHLKDHIRKRLPDTALINPSLEGALEIARTTENRGSGSTVFI